MAIAIIVIFTIVIAILVIAIIVIAIIVIAIIVIAIIVIAIVIAAVMACVKRSPLQIANLQNHGKNNTYGIYNLYHNQCHSGRRSSMLVKMTSSNH